MTKRFSVWLGFALVFGCAAGSVLRAQEYTFQSFTVSGAAAETENSLGVQGINDFGETSGLITDTSGNLKAWVRTADGRVTVYVEPRDKTTPSYTVAYHINNLGTSVGLYYDTEANEYLAFFYSAFGTFQTYSLAGYTETSLGGINDIGGLCGYVYSTSLGGWEAFVATGGKTTFFSVNGSKNTYCEEINDEGTAVGGYQDANGISHGWVRNPFNGSITPYDAPGASTVTGPVVCTGIAGGTILAGINNLGVMAGRFFDAENKEHGFVLSPGGAFKQVDVPGAFQTSLGAINDFGAITGHISDSSCNNNGYIGTPKGPFPFF